MFRCVVLPCFDLCRSNSSHVYSRPRPSCMCITEMSLALCFSTHFNNTHHMSSVALANERRASCLSKEPSPSLVHNNGLTHLNTESSTKVPHPAIARVWIVLLCMGVVKSEGYFCSALLGNVPVMCNDVAHLVCNNVKSCHPQQTVK